MSVPCAVVDAWKKSGNADGFPTEAASTAARWPRGKRAERKVTREKLTQDLS
jgi:hypothetical protein